MKGEPLVSIRCMVYNHEPYLRQCLDGFVMQRTTFPFEAIVHDDASTDGSAAIIREYAERYPDIIKPIYETENQYWKGTIGKIIRSVRNPNAKYFALCEGDDYWTDPLKLQKQVDALEAHPDCFIAFSKVKTVSKDGTPLDWTIPSKESEIPEGIVTLDDFMKEEYYNFRWTFHTSTFVYRKSYLDLHKQIWEKVYKHFPFGDQTIILSCLFQSNGYYIPQVTGCYRVLSGGYFSHLKADPEKEIQFYSRVLQAYRDLDDYTKGKYHEHISRRLDYSKYRILKLKFDHKMMNSREKVTFLFWDLWKVRSGFSSLKLSVAEFLSCIWPSWDSLIKR